MNERDAKKDLEVCEKATPGPWIRSRFGFNILTGDSEVSICEQRPIPVPRLVEQEIAIMEANAEFIIVAREALPYYIEELTKTQADCAVMREALEYVVKQIEGDYCPEEMSPLHKAIIKTSNKALSSTAGQDLLDRLAQAEKDRDKARAENTKLLQETNELLSRTHRAEQREKQLRDTAQTLFDSLESLMDSVNDCEEGYPPDVDLKRLINTVDDARSVLQQTEKEGAE